MREAITRLVTDAVAEAVKAGDLKLAEIPEPAIERPRDESHGDWATSIALRSAKAAGMPPRDIAAVIAKRMAEHPDIESVEIAGPGFINMRLSAAALQRVLVDARAADHAWGRVESGDGKRVQVEFVSANPTGPMHVGHGRWAALGDAIARVLEHAGWVVEREFYINDAGVQMDIFGASVAARYMELVGKPVEFPEDGYRGAFIVEIAEELRATRGDELAGLEWPQLVVECREAGYALVLDRHLKRVLHDMGVDFDVWFSERTLHAVGADGAPSEIERAIEQLRAAGHVYEAESEDLGLGSATWFRSTTFGDDKDRVLKKADGSYTYFAADVAYHWDKLELRGFDRVIDIWGADHHGYVPRMKAAVAALGHEGQLDVLLGQLVNLFRGGEAVRMSKRTGEMVTFEELLDEVGADAARYWFLRRSSDQAVDFDIEVAREQSADNPVYYVQYAHARICSILRKAAGDENGGSADEVAAQVVAGDADLSPLTDDAELTLMRRIDGLADVVERSAAELAPHRLTRYAEDLAATFHQFYTRCRVVDEAEPELTAARLYAVDTTRRVLRTVLALLGVSAPESM